MLRNGLHEFVGCEGLSESEEAMIPRIRFQLVKVLGEFVFVTGADSPDAKGVPSYSNAFVTYSRGSVVLSIRSPHHTLM